MPSDQELAQIPSQAKTLCLFSPKGGTGKTTISLVIARHLASVGKRVLVLDFDLVTAGATLYLSGNNRDALAPENCLFDILNLESSQDSTKFELGTIVPIKVPLKGNTTISLIASVRSAASSRGDIEEARFEDAFGVSGRELEHRVKALLSALKQDFDYIIIDTRGGLDEFSIIPPLLSDLGLLISDQSRLATYQLLHSRIRIEALARRLGRLVSMNETPAYRGVILNKSAGEPEVVKDKLEDTVLVTAGQPLLGVVPFVDDVLRSAERGEIPAPNIEFDYWLRRALREGLRRARMDEGPFESLGRFLWLRDLVQHRGLEVLVYLILGAAIVFATRAYYRFGEVSSELGLYSTSITAGLLAVCAIILAFLVYRSKLPRYVFSSTFVKWARLALVAVTLTACGGVGYTFWNAQREVAQSRNILATEIGPLKALRDAFAKTTVLARTEITMPGCTIRTISLTAPLPPSTETAQKQELEAVILPGGSSSPSFDEKPEIQTNGPLVTVTAKIRAPGTGRASNCTVGSTAAVLELRRKPPK